MGIPASDALPGYTVTCPYLPANSVTGAIQPHNLAMALLAGIGIKLLPIYPEMVKDAKENNFQIC